MASITEMELTNWTVLQSFGIMQFSVWSPVQPRLEYQNLHPLVVFLLVTKQEFPWFITKQKVHGISFLILSEQIHQIYHQLPPKKTVFLRPFRALELVN